MDFVCELFGPTLEHLVLRDSPVNMAAGSLLRNYLIATMTGLLSFNEISVTADERRSAELLYRPLMVLHRGGPTMFSNRPPRTEGKKATGTASFDSTGSQLKLGRVITGRKNVEFNSAVGPLSELTQNALRQHRLSAEFEVAFEETVKSIIEETLKTLTLQRR